MGSLHQKGTSLLGLSLSLPLLSTVAAPAAVESLVRSRAPLPPKSEVWRARPGPTQLRGLVVVTPSG